MIQSRQRCLGGLLLVALTLALPALVSAQEKVTPPWKIQVPAREQNLDSSNQSWGLDLTFPTTKMYTLGLSFTAPSTQVSGDILVDDAPVEKFKIPAGSTSVELPPIFFDEGTVNVTILVKKGSLKLTGLAIRDGLRMHSGPPRATPLNPLASNSTKKLMAFLAANYGKKIISGQQDLTWDDKINMVDRVKAQTGKEPALLGFDFLNYINPQDGSNGLKQIEEAIAWSKRGGIVTFCWHWRVGNSKEFYTGKTDFRISMDPGSTAYKTFIKDIDAIALELKRLQDADVPVLWRPLHEAAGGWFWWGASGPELYKSLWKLMYDRMVNHHKLNNLIWVSNGQGEAWYPGDDYADIVSIDIYGGDKMYNSWKDSWVLTQSFVTGDQAKMVALSENGPIPDPDNLIADQVPWSWFMTWNDGNKGKPEDDFFSGDKYMDMAHKKKVFNHDYVLTLDEIQGLLK